MKMMKKALSLLLVLAIGCSLCVTAFAANDDEIPSSVGSVAADITNTTKVGQDSAQQKQSEYGEVEKGELDDEHKCEVYVTKGSSYTVQIPKVVILDGTDGIGEYAVTVAGDIDGEKVVTVTPAATMTLTQAGKDDITATIEQDKTAWAFDEMEVLGNGTITVDSDENGNSLLTAGSWTGSFMMNISYEKAQNEVKMITFSLDGVEGFQAEEGMTWENWIKSDYNPEIRCPNCDQEFKMLYIKDNIYNNMILFHEFSDCDGDDYDQKTVFTGNYELVFLNDVIIAETNYLLSYGEGMD